MMLFGLYDLATGTFTWYTLFKVPNLISLAIGHVNSIELISLRLIWSGAWRKHRAPLILNAVSIGLPRLILKVALLARRAAIASSGKPRWRAPIINLFFKGGAGQRGVENRLCRSSGWML